MSYYKPIEGDALMAYEEFLKNPYIQHIAKFESWTISDRDKRPINMVKLIESLNPSNPNKANMSYLELASFSDNRCLVNLEKLLKHIKNPANLAYYVQDALTDGYVILDIEPSCPPELRDKFLKTNYIYGEISMSGKGYHLVYKTPDCFKNYPDAQKKSKMQAADKSYEFMLGQHYLTFTGKTIGTATGTDTIDNIFEELCKQQIHVDVRAVDITKNKPEIPNEDLILSGLRYVQLKKTLADFNNDDSRYEFGVCSRIYNQLKKIITNNTYNPDESTYDDNQKAWLVYQAVTDKIEHRAKHDTLRNLDNNAVPWLLWMSSQVIAKDTSYMNAVEEK